MTISFTGRLPWESTGTLSIVSTIDWPETTWPKTTCLLKQDVCQDGTNIVLDDSLPQCIKLQETTVYLSVTFFESVGILEMSYSSRCDASAVVLKIAKQAFRWYSGKKCLLLFTWKTVIHSCRDLDWPSRADKVDRVWIEKFHLNENECTVNMSTPRSIRLSYQQRYLHRSIHHQCRCL